MDCRETVHRHLLDLPRRSTDGIRFSSPTETSRGRFSLLCYLSSPQKSIFKIVCETKEPNLMEVKFFPLPSLNETGGYIPVPTNVKDIYSQYHKYLSKTMKRIE
jgi:hypothetical protein